VGGWLKDTGGGSQNRLKIAGMPKLIIEKAGEWRNIARPSNNGKINPATAFLFHKIICFLFAICISLFWSCRAPLH
jgi:hypothetical protein